MAKHGPGSAWLTVGGYRLGEYCTEFTAKGEAVLEESHTLGDSYVEQTPVGLQKLEIAAAGFYDDVNDGSDEAGITVNSGTSQIVVFGVAGQAPGARATGVEGAYVGTYERKPTRNELTKFAADIKVSGTVTNGIILQEFEEKSADWNTEGADSQDNGASSAGGGVAFQVVSHFSGFSGFVGKIRHSADDSTYADLTGGTFSNVTSAPNVQRLTPSATVNRHLAYDGNVTGTGTIQVCAVFSRNA